MMTAIDYSLGEIEGLARKAARGSGMEWGLADEAANATRWLCAVTLPGALELARLLRSQDMLPYSQISPRLAKNTWHPNGDALCPIVTGAALADRAELIAAMGATTLKRCRNPLFLLPFLSQIAQVTHANIRVDFQHAVFLLCDDGPRMVTRQSAHSYEFAREVIIEKSYETSGTLLPRTFRADVPTGVLEDLEYFAHRTYAPDNAQSREAGAGAGLTDND